MDNLIADDFRNRFRKIHPFVHPVVAFDDQCDGLLKMDFTAANTKLTPDVLNDTVLFTQYVEQELKRAGARYGIGGYDEHRTVYGRSRVFDDAAPDGEPRRLHLGIDIWSDEGTVIFAPLDGLVHSFAFNNAYGDYGATIILVHQVNDLGFYTLYGHLSLEDIASLEVNKPVRAGSVLAHMGSASENGQWPPHLHFQLIMDMGNYKGDYPGVCRLSERGAYLANCPDPDIILQMMSYAKLSP